MVSYLTEEGQVDLFGSQLVARQCYQVALDSGQSIGDEMRPETLSTREQYQSLSLVEKNPSAVDPLQPLGLSHGTEQITYTSSLLAQEELELLESILKRNKDIFA